MASALPMKVFLAGRVAVVTDDVVIDESRFPGRQGRLFFAYLVSERGRPVPRDELVEALWGEAPPATSDKALTVIASKLRGLLADGGVDGASALTCAFGCYRLELPEGTWVDVVAARRAAGVAEQALVRGDATRAKREAANAESLTRRPFLPGADGAWVEEMRRDLAGVRVRALSVLGGACLRLGEISDAVQWAEQMIALEPFRESGYRSLMEAHVAAGNQAEALQVYERCRRLLADELGAYPSPETELLYRALLEKPSAQGTAAPEPAGPSGRDVEPQLRRRPPRRGTLVAAACPAIAVLAVAGLVVFGRGGSPRESAAVAADSVGVFATQSGRLAGQAPVGTSPSAIAGGAGAVWVANTDGDSLSRLDPRTAAVVDTIPVGPGPSGVAVCRGFVWVANSLDGTVSRVAPQANAVVQRIRVGNQPGAVACGLGAVWVANEGDSTLVRIDPDSGHLVGRPISVDAGADAIAAGDGALWVVSTLDGSVARIDPRSGNIQQVGVGRGPDAVAAVAGSVWVSNGIDGTVSRIDPATDSVVAVVSVGAGPVAIAAAWGRGVWVSSELAGTLSEIDPARNAVAKRIATGNRPEGIAVARGRMYVAVRSSGAAHRGGTLVVYEGHGYFSQSGVDALDPATAYTTDPWQMMLITNDGLVTYDRAGGSRGNSLVPDLATSLPAPTGGGRTYTFEVRPGVHYSTGALVRPADFRRAIERSLTVPTPGAGPLYYTEIVGGAACVRTPRRCDLSRGIVTGPNTVTFHLTAADPDFLFKLALPTADAQPSATPLEPRLPLPSTGPYRISGYEFSRNGNAMVRLRRNPRFREWSPAAQPAGYPDRILIEYRRLSPAAVVRAVERGTIDLASLQPQIPSSLRVELRVRYAGRVHTNPLLNTEYIALNTRVPPFDDLQARRAFAEAIDRRRAAHLDGGLDLNRITCQVLPPNVFGYRRYCPNGASNLAVARRLVAVSGTRGQSVTLYRAKGFVEPVDSYIVSVLRQIGYKARLVIMPLNVWGKRVGNSHYRWQILRWGWNADFPSGSNFFTPLFTCGSFKPDSSDNLNESEFCDPRIDREVARALALRGGDPQAAAAEWARIDRDVTNLAPVVSYANGEDQDFVARCVGNYVYNQWSAGPLLDQLWVR